MTRLLILTSMLFTSAVFAQVEIPHVHENGDVIDANEINQNLDIVAKAVPPRDCSTNQIIKWNGSAWVCSSSELVSQEFSSLEDVGEASCPSGKTVTGGGCDVNDSANCSLTTSKPMGDLGGWKCEAYGGGDCAVKAIHAICQ